jgi:RecA-family ATPase
LLFEEILRLNRIGEIPTFTALVGSYQETFKLAEQDAKLFVDGVLSEVSSALDIDRGIRAVVDLHSRRVLIEAAREAEHEARQPRTSIDAISGLLLEKVEKVRTSQLIVSPEAQWAADLNKSLITSEQLRTLDLKPREPIVGDWFLEGDLGFIFAPRGIGKTWFALDLACGISKGEAVGPWEVHSPRRVLFLDGEMPLEHLQSRDKRLGVAGNNLAYLNHEQLYRQSGRVLNLAEPALQKALTELCLDNGISVVFVDNLSTLVYGVAENDGEAWELIQSWLLDLRRAGIAIVIVHHAGRNKEMRGHSKREDPAFWIIRLDTPHEQAGDWRGSEVFNAVYKVPQHSGSPRML